jgi:hypothetical protein
MSVANMDVWRSFQCTGLKLIQLQGFAPLTSLLSKELAMKTQATLARLMTPIALFLIFGVPHSFADEPIYFGYERWSNENVESGTAFALKPDEIYGKYADKWTLVGSPPPACGYRLIDIEPADMLGKKFNIVWIKNEGNYKAKSYFLHGLTEAEVHAIAQLDDLAILDIESYGSWGLPRQYAVIVRANPPGFNTTVLTGVTYSEIEDYLGRYNQRPVDIDMHQAEGEYPKMPKRYDESMNYYDAVFTQVISNFNKVDTFVAYGDLVDIWAIQEDYLLIDVENTGDWYQHYNPGQKYMYIFVDKGNTTRHLDFLAYLPEHAFNFSFYDKEKEFSRCIDIEDGSEGGAMAVFKD